MTELSTAFAPDWILLPGASILDAAEERGWTQLELAKRLGYSEKHMSQLINGKVSLSVEAAQRLERVLGSHLDFWLALEANYQKHKARLEANALHTSWVPWLDELPLKALIDCGAIPKLRLVSKNKPRLVDECLRFFGVASPADWRLNYESMQVSFRPSRAEQCDVAAITAWLRRGEQQAEDLQEHEANEWARNCLIPASEAPRLPILKTKKAVIGFAKEIGVHPGIVIGRLQHDKLIAASYMNDLKETLRL